MMTSRLVVLAVLAVAAVAAADSFRGDTAERATSSAGAPTAPAAGAPEPEYVAAGEHTRTRVLRRGRVYLSAAQVADAFPARLDGVPFDIGHLAVAPDETLALAVYKLPASGRVRAGIELWRDGELVNAFAVPTSALGGGLGFTVDGELVAIVPPDGHNAILFSRDGEEMGQISVTSW